MHGKNPIIVQDLTRPRKLAVESVFYKRCPRCRKTLAAVAFNKSKSRVDGLQDYCRECKHKFDAIYRRANKKKIKAYNAEWWMANPEKGRIYAQAFRDRDPERARKANRDWHKSNPTAAKRKARRWYVAHRQQAIEQARNWQRRNPDRLRANNAERRCRCVLATPVWSDRTAIQAIYNDAGNRTRRTGRRFHVDHIIPLKGVDASGRHIVCGLHVPNNLCIIPAGLNNHKYNKLPKKFEGWLAGDLCTV